MTAFVSQAELQNVLALREVVKSIKADLAKAEAELDAAEALLIYQLDQRRPVEPGPILASVVEQERRIPKWKEAFAEALGPAAVEQVIASTTPTVYRKLVVTTG